MNDTAWVKLWENTIYNHVWRDDNTAWKIFEYLLVSAYRGKPQGTTVKTLQQITDVCGGKNGTNFKAIKRLERYDMVETKSTNRNTTFKIQNWYMYQGNGSSGKNKVETKSKPSNTLIRIKNKELNIHMSSSAEKAALDILNDVTGRKFRTYPDEKRTRQTVKTFTTDEIRKALQNMQRDTWHKERIGSLSAGYLLSTQNIDKFLNYKTAMDSYVGSREKIMPFDERAAERTKK